jgi:hypothetical protein
MHFYLDVGDKLGEGIPWSVLTPLCRRRASAAATVLMQQPRPQLCRPLGTYTWEEKHPSSGGDPYSQDMHQEVITRHQLGLPIVSPELMALCQQYQYPSVWACRQYIRQFNASGHARPKYAMGNHMADRQVLGQHLLRLALYRIVHPEGTIAEARAFLLIWI